jgi:hypothetical protein
MIEVTTNVTKISLKESTYWARTPMFWFAFVLLIQPRVPI